MEKVVAPLSFLCWNVIENARLNVVTEKSRRCSHEIATAASSEAPLFLDTWPPTFVCGCVANACDARLARQGRRMPAWSQVESLMKYLEENPPPREVADAEVTEDPDPYIERWLEAAEEMHPSDEEDEYEDEDIRISLVKMVRYQSGDYRMECRFEPNRTFHFHVRALLHGHYNRYIAGRWHTSLHKLYCMSCVAAVNRSRRRTGEPLKFIGEAFNLTTDARGFITIPYWFRPSFFLSDIPGLETERETVADLIAALVLPALGRAYQLRWEFHCSSCYCNIFTENVSDVTYHVNVPV